MGSNQQVNQQMHESLATSAAESIVNQKSLLEAHAKRDGISVQDAFNKYAQASINESIGINSDKAIEGKVLSMATGVSGKIEGAARQQAQSTEDRSYGQHVDHSITANELKQWQDNQEVIERYQHSADYTHGHSQADVLAQRAVADYRQAAHASQQVSADLNQAQRATEMANYAETHTEAIQSNLNQRVVDQTRQIYGAEADRYLTNTTDPHAQSVLKEVANQIIQQDIATQSAAMQQKLGAINPATFYQQSSQVIHDRSHSVRQVNQMDSGNVSQMARGSVSGYGLTKDAGTIQQTVDQQVIGANYRVLSQSNQLHKTLQHVQTSGQQRIRAGKTDAQSGLTSHGYHTVTHIPKSIYHLFKHQSGN